MSTLSPFHYMRVARYLLAKWSDLPAYVASTIKSSNSLKPNPEASAGTGTGTGTGKDAPFPIPSSQPDPRPETEPAPSPSDPSSRPPRPDKQPDPRYPAEPVDIYRLMNDSRLLIPGAIKPPREIVVLCHGGCGRRGGLMAGLYGFSTATPIPLFPSLKLHYWASVLEVLRDKMGCKVVVVGVKG
jgi:triacylglycerol lipase